MASGLPLPRGTREPRARASDLQSDLVPERLRFELLARLGAAHKRA